MNAETPTSDEVYKPEYLQEDCPNCGAYQVDYSGLCRACLRQWTVERDETDDGDFTRLY